MSPLSPTGAPDAQPVAAGGGSPGAGADQGVRDDELREAWDLCCGIANALVLSDVSDPHWGGLNLASVPILMIDNVLVALVAGVVFVNVRVLATNPVRQLLLCDQSGSRHILVVFCS